VQIIFMYYPWPGNVREMENTLEHAFIVCRQNTITVDHLPQNMKEFFDKTMPSSVQHDGIGAEAVIEALEKAGWKPGDLDLIEANEAFAAQALAVNKDVGWDTNKVNVNGGAIAIGHPIGASGARILTTLLHEMQKRDAKKGLATLCIGGGMGIAMCVERD